MEATSNQEIKLCKVSEIPSGQAKSFSLNGKEIGVFNINKNFYAMDNLCIHAGAPLSDGAIDTGKCQVSCCWHAWTFDLATGKCISHPRQDVFAACYTIKIKNDDLYLQIPEVR